MSVGGSSTRFLVSTSDILEGGQKVYIRDEKGDIRWTKTRTLALKEIIDELHVNDSVAYSIHRPTRGWYIQVRSPSSSFLLAPDPLADPNSQDADSELVIQFPVNSGHVEPSTSGLEAQDEYSFPPTPSIKSPPPGRATPSPAPPSASLDPGPSEPHTDPLRSPDPPQPKPSQPAPITQTITLHFAPTPPPTLPTKPTFSRSYASGLWRVVANAVFSPPRRSFVLSSRASPSVGSLPTPMLETAVGGRVPVVTYTDTTPVFSVSQMTGVLEVDLGAVGEDADVGLLVAAAMAYLDFLGDREGYIAAANGG